MSKGFEAGNATSFAVRAPERPGWAAVALQPAMMPSIICTEDRGQECLFWGETKTITCMGIV